MNEKEYAAEITMKVYFNTNKDNKNEIENDIWNIIKSLIEKSSFTGYDYIDVLEILDCTNRKVKQLYRTKSEK